MLWAVAALLVPAIWAYVVIRTFSWLERRKRPPGRPSGPDYQI